MVFFRKPTERSSSGRKPVDVARLTEHLAVAVWTAEDDDGTFRLDWALNRLGRNGESRRTIQAAQLLELPECIVGLASAFAKVGKLPAELRAEFAALADAMQGLVERRKSNGPAVTIRPDDANRVFAI